MKTQTGLKSFLRSSVVLLALISAGYLIENIGFVAALFGLWQACSSFWLPLVFGYLHQA